MISEWEYLTCHGFDNQNSFRMVHLLSASWIEWLKNQNDFRIVYLLSTPYIWESKWFQNCNTERVIDLTDLRIRMLSEWFIYWAPHRFEWFKNQSGFRMVISNERVMDLRGRSVSCIDDSCEKNCNTKFHGIKFKNHKAGKLNFSLRLLLLLKLLIQGLLWVWVLPMTNDVTMQCTSLVVTTHTQNDPSYTNINSTSRTNFETILSETLVVIHWYSVSFCLWLGMFVFTDLRWPRVFATWHLMHCSIIFWAHGRFHITTKDQRCVISFVCANEDAYVFISLQLYKESI